jgi:hypothetical protein
MLLALVSGCSNDGKMEAFADFKWPSGDKDKDKDKAQPVVSMAGRWLLSSTNRGQCGMNFTGALKATEGTIAPEGGCPGNFFTSRKWTLEDGNVIIRDHTGAQLAQLSPATQGGKWFEGQAATGERIMLARQ